MSARKSIPQHPFPDPQRQQQRPHLERRLESARSAARTSERFPTDEVPTDLEDEVSNDEASDDIGNDSATLSETQHRIPLNEPGLSVDPEDLALHFLVEATQQDNLESEWPIDVRMDDLELEAVDWDAKTEPERQQPLETESWRDTTDLDLSLPASLFETEPGGYQAPRAPSDPPPPPDAERYTHTIQRSSRTQGR